MRRHVGMLVLGLIAFAPAAFAQAPPAQAAPAAQRAVQEKLRQEVERSQAPVKVAVDSSAGGQPVNIRLDLSITDQVGGVAAPSKTLMMLLADKSFNQLRSSFEDRTLNIDAKPTIVDGRVRLFLNIQSEPLMRNPDPFAVLSQRQNQSLTTILENGKALVVMESTDPASKRKVTVEVKATILK